MRMPSTSMIVPVVVLAGLVSVSQAAPVPPPAIAEAQLRAINHRFVDAFVVSGGDFIDRLTAGDFVLTASDGGWHDRTAFVARMRKAAPLGGASYDDVRLRLFGPVALLHAVFEGVQPDGKVAKIRYTDVYVWHGTDWRLVSGQNTPIKADVPLRQQTATAPAHAPWQAI